MGDLTTLLDAARLGDDAALDQLCSVMYRELRQLAHARLKRSEHITLLDTTSLVHEAYLRLTKVGRLNVTDRSHFLAYAARVMRSIIVDFVRQRRADRRGGEQQRVTLDTDIAESAHAETDQVIRVNDALLDLEQVDGRLVRVVEMRYFAGMSEQEIAECLGVTDRTVRRDWEKARSLLSAALQSPALATTP
jgi:RNA polymerase sigma factor (TIGR02999 family)